MTLKIIVHFILYKSLRWVLAEALLVDHGNVLQSEQWDYGYVCNETMHYIHLI